MTRLLLLFAVACGALPSDPSLEDDLAVVGTLSAQSFVHGDLRAYSIAYSLHAAAGDVIAPDVWATPGSPLKPTLTLLGPRAAGHRAALAQGSARGRGVAIDGFHVPKTGDYLVVVGHATPALGAFTLRLWMQSSHAPRQEGSQLQLTLQPSSGVAAAGDGPWSDATLDALVAEMAAQRDPLAAFSDAELLLARATSAQRPRVQAAAGNLLGTPAHFRALPPAVQARALWWLGALLFDMPDAKVSSIDATVKELVASWPGARQTQRLVKARVYGGAVYGYQADWSAEQDETDGTPIWVDFATEWFDASGHWLGEQSAGASEPEDD